MPFNYSDLNDNAKAIAQQAAERIHQLNRKQAESIIAVGRQLLLVREALRHGKFGKWLTHEFGWGRRTAYNYMHAAEVFGEKSAIVAHLQPSTLYEFSKPKLPEPMKQEVRRILDAEEPIEDSEFWKRMARVSPRKLFEPTPEPPYSAEAVRLADFLLDRFGTELEYFLNVAIFEPPILQQAISILNEFNMCQDTLYPTRLTRFHERIRVAKELEAQKMRARVEGRSKAMNTPSARLSCAADCSG